MNITMGQPMDQNMQQAEDGKIYQREVPEVDPARAALVKAWHGRIIAAEKYWEPTFKQMRADMDFARGKQWPGQTDDDDRYVANIVQRHIQQRTATLYAKNPRFLYRRKKRLDFAIWDGRQATLQEAIRTAAMASSGDAAAMAMLPNAMQLLADVQEGFLRRQQVDRVGKTLEILAQHELSEQKPPFKKQMKQLIRRTLTCKVGYVKLGFERMYEPRPEDEERVRDLTQHLARIDQLIADAKDGETESYQAEAEELRLMLQELQRGGDRIVREGIVFDFPTSDSIIIDPACRQLQGFIGASWIAHKFCLSNDTVKQVYGVDLKASGALMYNRGDDNTLPLPVGLPGGRDIERQKDGVVLYEIQDKTTGMVFTIADGYPDFLREPAAPSVKLERFWTIFALTFNDLENDRNIYPPSDVELLRPMQIERNLARERLSEHRTAARPATATARGTLTDDDKAKLETHPANAVIELDGLAPNQKIEDVLQVVKKPGIDPNLYVVNHLDEDQARVVGVQDAGIGVATGGTTATEVSIAEGARTASVASNVDDLDDFLTELAQAVGHVLLTEISEETAKKVAGPGAVWPMLSLQDIADDIILEVEAGSTGRPNRAAEIANFERMAPLIMQIPGINPEWLAREALRRLDDRLDVEDALLDGMPPITTLARGAIGMLTGGGAAPTGNAATDPVMQGAQGAGNAPQPPGAEMRPPAMPAESGRSLVPGPPSGI